MKVRIISELKKLFALSFSVDIGTDSDEEGQVKNVSHLVLRPLGHTGRAKKGHLIFDAAFESGNLSALFHRHKFENILQVLNLFPPFN